MLIKSQVTRMHVLNICVSNGIIYLCTSQWKAPHPHTRGMRGISGRFQRFWTVNFATVCGVFDSIWRKYMYRRAETLSGA